MNRGTRKVVVVEFVGGPWDGERLAMAHPVGPEILVPMRVQSTVTAVGPSNPYLVELPPTGRYIASAKGHAFDVIEVAEEMSWKVASLARWLEYGEYRGRQYQWEGYA